MASCFSHPQSHGDSLEGLGSWLFWSDLLRGNQKGPTGSHAYCQAQVLCQEYECWEPRWICDHKPRCPHRQTPMQSPGTSPRYVESRSLVGREGKNKQMSLFSYPSAGSGQPNLDKIFTVLVISLICMKTVCFTDTASCSFLIRILNPLNCNCSFNGQLAAYGK